MPDPSLGSQYLFNSTGRSYVPSSFPGAAQSFQYGGAMANASPYRPPQPSAFSRLFNSIPGAIGSLASLGGHGIGMLLDRFKSTGTTPTAAPTQSFMPTGNSAGTSSQMAGNAQANFQAWFQDLTAKSYQVQRRPDMRGSTLGDGTYIPPNALSMARRTPSGLTNLLAQVSQRSSAAQPSGGKL